MLNVLEYENLLNFLDRVPVTGYREARTLAALAIKLEQVKMATVDTELAAKYAPKPIAGLDKAPQNEVIGKEKLNGPEPKENTGDKAAGALARMQERRDNA